MTGEEHWEQIERWIDASETVTPEMVKTRINLRHLTRGAHVAYDPNVTQALNANDESSTAEGKELLRNLYAAAKKPVRTVLSDGDRFARFVST